MILSQILDPLGAIEYMLLILNSRHILTLMPRIQIGVAEGDRDVGGGAVGVLPGGGGEVADGADACDAGGLRLDGLLAEDDGRRVEDVVQLRGAVVLVAVDLLRHFILQVG